MSARTDDDGGPYDDIIQDDPEEATPIPDDGTLDDLDLPGSELPPEQHGEPEHPLDEDDDDVPEDDDDDGLGEGGDDDGGAVG